METLTLEKSLTSAKEVNKKDSLNEEIIKKTEVKDSPFNIIEVDGEFFGSMGQYRVTETYDSHQKCKKELEKITWNRLIQVIMILGELKEKREILNNNK
jgi:hypothetical protein